MSWTNNNNDGIFWKSLMLKFVSVKVGFWIFLRRDSLSWKVRKNIAEYTIFLIFWKEKIEVSKETFSQIFAITLMKGIFFQLYFISFWKDFSLTEFLIQKHKKKINKNFEKIFFETDYISRWWITNQEKLFFLDFWE